MVMTVATVIVIPKAPQRSNATTRGEERGENQDFIAQEKRNKKLNLLLP
jgi:hypothetical protein